MHATSFIVGSAAARALTQLQHLERRDDFPEIRTVDLLNAAAHSCERAHKALRSDAAEAQACLIHGASRLLAAAGRIDLDPSAMNVRDLRSA